MPLRKQPITEEEFKAIIQEILKVKPYTKDIDKRIFFDWKWAIMLCFHYYMGLRPRELRLIEISHIDFTSHTLFIPAMNEKMRTHKTMYIPNVLFIKLMAYLKVRCKVIKKSRYLFPSVTSSDRAQDKNYLGVKLNKVMKKLNMIHLTKIDKLGHKVYNKSLYSLRRGFATRVYQATGKIEDVEAALGHHDMLMRNAWIYVETERQSHLPEILEKVYKGGRLYN